LTKPHPEPPTDRASLRIVIVSTSYAWCRIHGVGREPIFFGREPVNRFDAPAGEFGVLYLARDAHGAFIETFGHDTGRTPFVTEAELRSRELSVVRASRPLRLVDLRGHGLARMGADAALTSGPDYDLVRRWALALHEHPRKPDGILYRARHDPGRSCAAIFDRASTVITGLRSGTLLDAEHARLVADILDRYGYGLVP
jgi:hypothetical protein